MLNHTWIRGVEGHAQGSGFLEVPMSGLIARLQVR